MTQAIIPRRDGDAFQARLFWYHAADLLRDGGAVRRIGFEAGPKGFDDLWVEYDPGRAPEDARGQRVLREHLQCKWHSTHGSYGFNELMLPDFINAESTSILQRALAAQRIYAPTGQGARFRLVTNWRPADSDPLRELVNTRSDALRVPMLFGTKTDKSKMGRVRQAWREHLGIDDTQLELLAHTLGFTAFSLSPEMLRNWLNDRFETAGLRPVSRSQLTLPHDDIVFQWAAQRRNEFDKASFREACASQDLLGPAKSPPVVFGVKSFEHPIDRLEDRCAKVLNLVPAFHDRFIQNDDDWEKKIFPQLQSFLVEAAKSQSVSLRLALDAHTTLAFAAGAVLNVKSGRHVAVEQRTTDRSLWTVDDHPIDPDWPTLTTDLIELDSGKPDIAVAIGLTHDIKRDVHAFIKARVPSVGRMLICTPSAGSGSLSVRGGNHASILAEAMLGAVNATRIPGTARTVHLFIAAPNAFAFFAGQRQPALGRTTLYEFDFGQDKTGSYEPSLTLPVHG